jgi:hypothetical protein
LLLARFENYRRQREHPNGPAWTHNARYDGVRGATNGLYQNLRTSPFTTTESFRDKLVSESLAAGQYWSHKFKEIRGRTTVVEHCEHENLGLPSKHWMVAIGVCQEACPHMQAQITKPERLTDSGIHMILQVEYMAEFQKVLKPERLRWPAY